MKKYKPLDDDAMRRALQRCIDRSDIPERITKKPHWFWRDGRALYWASKDKNENFLRGFFGWSKNSDAPKYYIELMQESLLAGVREDYGENLNKSEKKFSRDNLKPYDCPECGEYASPLWSYCKNCEGELENSLKAHNSPDEVMEAALEDIASQNSMKNIENPAKNADTVSEMNKTTHEVKSEVIETLTEEFGLNEEQIEESIRDSTRKRMKEKGFL